jgi:hypothetical protein
MFFLFGFTKGCLRAGVQRPSRRTAKFKTGKETTMSEQLLTQTDVTRRLHISKTTFTVCGTGWQRWLEHVILGGMIRYRQEMTGLTPTAEKRNR